jgi:hypothetical protein
LRNRKIRNRLNEAIKKKKEEIEKEIQELELLDVNDEKT